jgi:hypothetical protein
MARVPSSGLSDQRSNRITVRIWAVHRLRILMRLDSLSQARLSPDLNDGLLSRRYLRPSQTPVHWTKVSGTPGRRPRQKTDT